MIDIHHVPIEEFRRAEALDAPPETRARLFATLCRLNALYMITRAGSGHIGSSFSSLDIVSWLFLHEMAEEPRPAYFSSKGHDVPGLYAVLAARGLIPFEMIHALRRLGGLPGHPDVSIPYMETNTGSLGMGISKAKGMALAERLAGRRRRIFVLTGDGELQEGQIWEALSGAANRGLAEITAIVDHNKIQSDTWVAAVSDLGDIEARWAAFGWRVFRCDGHDPAALARTLAAAKAVNDRPQVVIADTVKGKGVSFMESLAPGEKLYKFHSGAPNDASYERAAAELVADANRQLHALGAAPLALVSSPRPERRSTAGEHRLVAAYGRALVDEAANDPSIVALDADLVLDTGLIPFSERFPDRFIECGIAEQDMVSMAGGLARRGRLPVVHSFACFLSARPNEQIYNNATERTKIVYVGSLAGLVPAGPGHSHQCVRDIASLAAVPGLVLLEPSCEPEVPLALAYCLRGTRESCYLRLVTWPCIVPYALPAGYRLEEGRGVALTRGEDAVLFGYGPLLLSEAVRAAALLRERHGLGLRVVNLPWLNRVDSSWLAEAVHGFRVAFTLDNHYVAGGQGEMLLARLAELGLADGLRVRRFGVEGIPRCGQPDEVLRAHGLDAESLARAIAAFVEARAAGG